jgi:hypothetical protein
MTKLSVECDDAILVQAKIRAAAEGTTVSAKVCEYLMQFADVEKALEAGLQALPIFMGSTGLTPGIDPGNNQSMLRAADARDCHVKTSL